MNKLNIPQAHFSAAQHYFDHTPGAVKYSKKINNMPYSFVKVEDKVYAKGYRLGAGAFGIVSMGENALHENFAIKVEGHGINNLDRSESEILKLVGYHYGFAERQLDKEITFSTGTNSTLTDKKLYKVMKLLDGNDLIDEIYDVSSDSYTYKNTLTQTQSLIIAIKCCQNLMRLHQKRIIHRDIKPENIKTKIAGNDITVSFMDFGLSVIMPAGKTVYPVNEVAGTPLYMAPEIYNENHPELSKGETSYASDIYALGILFQEDLQLSEEVFGPMIKQNPRARINLQGALNKLVSQLERQPNLDQHARAVITSVKGARPLPKAPVARIPQIVPAQVEHKIHAPQQILSVRNVPANRIRVMVDVQPGFKLKPVVANPAPRPAVAPAVVPAVAKAAPVVAKAAPVVAKAAPVVAKAAPVVAKAAPVVAKAAPVVAKAAPVVAKAPAAVVKPAPAVVKPAPVVAKVAPVVAKAAPAVANGLPQKHDVIKMALIHCFENQKKNAPSPFNLKVPQNHNEVPLGMKNYQKIGVKVF